MNPQQKAVDRVVAIVSGGLDSTVLAYELRDVSTHLHLLSFNYGQRHKKELLYAQQTAAELGADHHIVDLTSITPLLKGSSLSDPTIEVPDGHYAEETMRITVVPNRNAIMLSIAYGYAVSLNARLVGLAVHAGDHFIYPDCRTPFIAAIDQAFHLGNDGFGNPNLHLYAPYSQLTKAQIVEHGAKIGVPFTETWSCYKGGDIHCGTCGTCTERREAFMLAGVDDTTTYLATPPIQIPLA